MQLSAEPENDPSAEQAAMAEAVAPAPETEEKATSTESSIQVNYIEVSHWWETDDEKVLVALGVDGSVHRLVKVSKDGDISKAEGGFWKKLGAALEKEASGLRQKGTLMRFDIRKKSGEPGADEFDLGNGMVAVETQNVARPAVATQSATAKDTAIQTPSVEVEKLRLAMWRARASHQMPAGVALLIASGALLALGFFTAYAPFEILSMVSFVGGVFMLATEAEARVKLIPAAEANAGPLLSLAEDLRSRGFTGRAAYVPHEGAETSMEVGRGDGTGNGGDTARLEPVGRGLVRSYASDLGPLGEAELDYLKLWLPRVVVKGLGLASRLKVEADENGESAKAILTKPFVRPLCVREEITRDVCGTIGCPLVSSIGEALASSEKKRVEFGGCVYDPVAQRATASFKIERTKDE